MPSSLSIAELRAKIAAESDDALLMFEGKSRREVWLEPNPVQPELLEQIAVDSLAAMSLAASAGIGADCAK